MSSTQDRACDRTTCPPEVVHDIETISSHVSQVDVGKIPFHHQEMSDDIDDIQDPRYHMSRRTFLKTGTWVFMGLGGFRMFMECRLVVTCNFDPLEHVPQTSVRAQNCALVSGRAPCAPWSREHEKRPAAGREKKKLMCEKHTFIPSNISYIYSIIVHAGCSRLVLSCGLMNTKKIVPPSCPWDGSIIIAITYITINVNCGKMEKLDHVFLRNRG